MSDRNWEKEYNEMLAACLESGQAYEKIIAEKNSELARLRAEVDYWKRATRHEIFVFASRPGIKLREAYAATDEKIRALEMQLNNQLTAALNESEPK